MPFGLKNAPAIFQAIVEEVLRPVSSFSRNYVDDVVVFSGSWERHLEDVRRVMNCLGEAGLMIKKRKCKFRRKYMEYLGHQIGCGCVAVPELCVRALKDFKRPQLNISCGRFWAQYLITGSLWTGSRDYHLYLPPGCLSGLSCQSCLDREHVRSLSSVA